MAAKKRPKGAPKKSVKAFSSKGKGALTPETKFPNPPKLTRAQKELVKRLESQFREAKHHFLVAVRTATEQGGDRAKAFASKYAKKVNSNRRSLHELQAARIYNSRKPAQKTVAKHLEQLSYIAQRASTASIGIPVKSNITGGAFYDGRMVALDVDFLTGNYVVGGSEAETAEAMIFNVAEAVTDLEIDNDLAKSEWASISLMFSFPREDYTGGRHDEGATRGFKRVGANRARITVWAQRINYASGLPIVVSQAFTMAQRMHGKRPDARLERITLHLQWNPGNEQPAGLG